jgi:hypothetical protein
VGINITYRDFRLLLVRNVIEEAGKSQDRHPNWGRFFFFCDSRVAITNTGQRKHQPSCDVVCVLLAAKETAQCISVPGVTRAYARSLFRGKSQKCEFVNHPLFENVCKDKMIEVTTDLLEQTELCNGILKPHFI